MKVKELIAALKRTPPSAEVLIEVVDSSAKRVVGDTAYVQRCALVGGSYSDTEMKEDFIVIGGNA